MLRPLAILATAAALLLLAVPGAMAAQEFGDRCEANDSEAGWTAIVLENSFPDLQLPSSVPPEGPKVITRWKVTVGPGLAPPLQQQLVTLKLAGEESFKPIGESAVETLHEGVNEFATRIPVSERDHIGLRGPSQTLFCDHASGHFGGIVAGPWPLEEARHYKGESDLGVPVVAYVENDGDHDGYGDETQDACPGNAAVATPCPSIGLRARAVQERKGSILVTAKVNFEAGIFVRGQVRWKEPKPNGGTRSVRVTLSGGRWYYVKPGESAGITVPLKKHLRDRLQQLDPGEALRAWLTVTATDSLGRSMDRHVFVRLHGRAK